MSNNHRIIYTKNAIQFNARLIFLQQNRELGQISFINHVNLQQNMQHNLL